MDMPSNENTNTRTKLSGAFPRRPSALRKSGPKPEAPNDFRSSPGITSPIKTHPNDGLSPSPPPNTSSYAVFNEALNVHPTSKRAASDGGTSAGSNLKKLNIDDRTSRNPAPPRQGPTRVVQEGSSGARPVTRAVAHDMSVPTSPSSPMHDRHSSPTQTSQHPTRNSLQSTKGSPYVDAEALRHSERSAVQTHDSIDSDIDMLRQPETKPITQEQLVNEVKGIYAGLVMVEKKCINMPAAKSNYQQALERAMASTDCSTSNTSSRAPRLLPGEPASYRITGTTTFGDQLLRHRLPDSLDHMLAFVYLAYSMMALLMESVPSFIETWIECLGDLARYRMAIEEADLRDREIWSNVARMWYNKAADKSPNVGRIQHHLAVLARPNIVQQLFYYSKSLVSAVPFVNERESVMLLFTPFLQNNEITYGKYPVVEASLVSAWAIVFNCEQIPKFTIQAKTFLAGLDPHISRTSTKYKVQGVEIASSLIAGIMHFGFDDNHLWSISRAFLDKVKSRLDFMQGADPSLDIAKVEREIKRNIQEEAWRNIEQDSAACQRLPSTQEMSGASKFSSSNEVAAFTAPVFGRATVVAQRIGDKNIMPYMHVVMAFLWSSSFIPGALVYLEGHIPWDKIVMFLNTLGRSGVSDRNIESEDFPPSAGGTGRQLPEDFPIRGLVWSQHYYQSEFFTTNVVDEDDRTLEMPSHAAPRAERCLWLGVRLSKLNRYFQYNYQSKQFHTTAYANSLLSGISASNLAVNGHSEVDSQTSSSENPDTVMSMGE